MAVLELTRKESIDLASFIQMLELPNDLLKSKREDALVELAISESTEADANMYLREYLKVELEITTNHYLENLLVSHGYNVVVTGEEPGLFPCFCCGYQTLEKRGEYFICSVCYWEDDGGLDPDRFSSVNRMTITEGRSNYESFGAKRTDLAETLYDDRKSRFRRT